jgi:ankyrin repeat protein
LIVAAKWGYLEIVKLLLDNGADVNAWAWDTMEQTALMEASDQGHLELVKFLLQKGASVHFKNKNGWTALKLAGKEGHTKIVELLKAHGAKE